MSTEERALCGNWQQCEGSCGKLRPEWFLTEMDCTDVIDGKLRQYKRKECWACTFKNGFQARGMMWILEPKPGESQGAYKTRELVVRDQLDNLRWWKHPLLWLGWWKSTWGLPGWLTDPKRHDLKPPTNSSQARLQMGCRRSSFAQGRSLSWTGMGKSFAFSSNPICFPRLDQCQRDAEESKP